MKKPTIIYLEGLPAVRQNQTPEEQSRRQEILRCNNRILDALSGRVQNSALSENSIPSLLLDEAMNAERSLDTNPLESMVQAVGWWSCFAYVKRNFGLWQALVWMMRTIVHIAGIERRSTLRFNRRGGLPEFSGGSSHSG